MRFDLMLAFARVLVLLLAQGRLAAMAWSGENRRPCLRRPGRSRGAAVNDPTALLGELLADLTRPDPDLRWRAAEGMKHLGPQALRYGMRQLLVALHDDQPRVRIAAAGALVAGRPLPEDTLPDLMRALLNEDASIRAWCSTRSARCTLAASGCAARSRLWQLRIRTTRSGGVLERRSTSSWIRTCERTETQCRV